MTAPHTVALVLSTYNALPHARMAVDGIARQTYRNFRLIVQDGGSTDGTIDYFRTLDAGFPVDIAVESDTGVAQAYARGLRRVTEPYVMIVAADEILAHDAIESLLAQHRQHEDAAVVYGSMNLIDKEKTVIQHFQPRSFDFKEVMECITVPPISTCMFNRQIIGEDFYYDETLRTCPDYEFWIRIGARFQPEHFVTLTRIIAEALGDRTSMSFRPESHIQFVKDKVFALRRFLSHTVADPSERRRQEIVAVRGIHCWGAEMMLSLDGPSSGVYDLLRSALTLGPPDERLSKLLSSSLDIEVWSKNPSRPAPVDAPAPPKNGAIIVQSLELTKAYIGSDWGSTVSRTAPIDIVGSDQPWSYSWQLPIDVPATSVELWLRVVCKQVRGAPSMGILIDNRIYDERTLCSTEDESLVVQFRLYSSEFPRFSLLLRNSGQPAGAATILAVELVQDPQSAAKKLRLAQRLKDWLRS